MSKNVDIIFLWPVYIIILGAYLVTNSLAPPKVYMNL